MLKSSIRKGELDLAPEVAGSRKCYLLYLETLLLPNKKVLMAENHDNLDDIQL
jgi:hypothetical protein